MAKARKKRPAKKPATRKQRARASNVSEQLLADALKSIEGVGRDEARAAKKGAQEAAKAFKKLKKEKDDAIRDALRKAAKSNRAGWAALAPSLMADDDSCDGTDCTVSCAAGCLVGCLIGGGTTIAFGTLGGTVGGGGASIADNKLTIAM